MIENHITRVFDKTGNKVRNITTYEVVLEALCAYQKMILTNGGDGETTEHHQKSDLAGLAIQDVMKDMLSK